MVKPEKIHFQTMTGYHDRNTDLKFGTTQDFVVKLLTVAFSLRKCAQVGIELAAGK